MIEPLLHNSTEAHPGRSLLLALLAIAFLAVLFSLRNPLAFSMAPGFDASLFATMGKMWAQGAVPYRDMIDIKGPIIFAVDALGYRLGHWQGIWALECLLSFIGLFAMNSALSSLRISPLSRGMALMAPLALYGSRYYYGNMTEDWAFHLALVSQWGFLQLHGQKRYNLLPSLVIGFAFATVIGMRLNNGALWGAGYFALFLWWLWLGRWRDAVYLLTTSLACIALVVLPILVYFQTHQALSEMWYYSFGIFFDGSYGHGFSLLTGSVGFWRTGLFLLLPAFCLQSFWPARKMHEQEKHLQEKHLQPEPRRIAIAILLACSFIVISNAVSGNVFDHYDVLYLPLLIIPLATLLQTSSIQPASLRATLSAATLLWWAGFVIVEQALFGWSHNAWSLQQVQHVVMTSLMVGALPALATFGWRYRPLRNACTALAIILVTGILVWNAFQGQQTGRPNNASTQTRVDYLLAHSRSNDRLWVEGAHPQYYLWSGLTPAAPYLFFRNVSPPFDVDERNLQHLAAHQPRYIIMQRPPIGDRRRHTAASFRTRKL